MSAIGGETRVLTIAHSLRYDATSIRVSATLSLHGALVILAYHSVTLDKCAAGGWDITEVHDPQFQCIYAWVVDCW